MKALIQGFDWIIEFFKSIFSLISNIFEVLGLVFEYVHVCCSLAVSVILTLPSWLQAFGVITISICAIYMVVGREAGKTDSKGGSK